MDERTEQALKAVAKEILEATLDEEEEDDMVDVTLAHAWPQTEIAYYGPTTRTLIFFGDIEHVSAATLISQLLELERLTPGVPIEIHLNSDGGDVSDGFAIYDVIKSLTSPVMVTVLGNCGSAALLILAAADVRWAMPNAIFFYHQAILCMDSIHSSEQAGSIVSMYKHHQERYDETLRCRAKITRKQWKETFLGKPSKYLTSEEALELNFLDDVVVYPDKVPYEMD